MYIDKLKFFVYYDLLQYKYININTNKMARYKEENKRKEAFGLYRKGTKLVDIAEVLKVTQPLISQWKKDDDWDGKLSKVKGMLKARMTLKETSENSVMVEEDLDQLKVLRELEDIIFDRVYNGEIEPKTWSDVISTLRFTDEKRRLIRGKPTVTTETKYTIDVQGLDDEELDAKIKETQRAIALFEQGENKE